MLKIQLKPEDVTLKFPDSWKDITIGQYSQILKNLQSDKDENKKAKSLLKIITGQNVGKFTVINVEKLLRMLMVIINEPPQDQRIKSFEFRGKEYQLCDDDFQNITFDRYMDLHQLRLYTADFENNPWQYFAGMIATLVDDYNDETHLLFENLPMSIAWQVFFFIKMRTTVLKNTLSSISQEVREAKTN